MTVQSALGPLLAAFIHANSGATSPPIIIINSIEVQPAPSQACNIDPSLSDLSQSLVRNILKAFEAVDPTYSSIRPQSYGLDDLPDTTSKRRDIVENYYSQFYAELFAVGSPLYEATQAFIETQKAEGLEEILTLASQSCVMHEKNTIDEFVEGAVSFANKKGVHLSLYDQAQLRDAFRQPHTHERLNLHYSNIEIYAALLGVNASELVSFEVQSVEEIFAEVFKKIDIELQPHIELPNSTLD